jgi:hypothetical protein
MACARPRAAAVQSQAKDSLGIPFAQGVAENFHRTHDVELGGFG